MTVLSNGVKELFEATQHRSCQDIGHMFVEYVLESGHSGWEGFSRHDLPAIGKLLQDFASYMNNSDPIEQVPVYTGTRYLTTDR